MSEASLGPFGALAFDLDGTLVATEPLYAAAARAAALEEGICFDDESYWIHGKGRPLQAFLSVIGVPPEHLPRVHRRAREHFRSGAGRIATVPGVREFLSHVSPLPRCVVTSADRETARFILRSAGLIDDFDFVVDAEDVQPGRVKPHADPYRLAARRLRMAPDRCVAFEDSLDGVAAARAAGMCVLAIEAGPSSGGGYPGASLRVPDFTRLRPRRCGSTVTFEAAFDTIAAQSIVPAGSG